MATSVPTSSSRTFARWALGGLSPWGWAGTWLVFLGAMAACRPQPATPSGEAAASVAPVEAPAGTPPPPHPIMTPAWLTPPAGAGDLDVAREAMVAFFDYLANGRYREAAALFEGSYTTYEQWNPDIPAGETAKLWQAVCSKQLPCLPVSRVVASRTLGEDTFEFTVAFVRRDGTLFTLGPCCGQTSGPLTWRFPVTVVRREGKFGVVTGPVYGH